MVHLKKKGGAQKVSVGSQMPKKKNLGTERAPAGRGGSRQKTPPENWLKGRWKGMPKRCRDDPIGELREAPSAEGEALWTWGGLPFQYEKKS